MTATASHALTCDRCGITVNVPTHGSRPTHWAHLVFDEIGKDGLPRAITQWGHMDICPTCATRIKDAVMPVPKPYVMPDAMRPLP